MFGTGIKENPIEPPWYCEDGWPDEEEYIHILDIPFRRKTEYIQGFTGQIPNSREIFGESIIQNLKKSEDQDKKFVQTLIITANEAEHSFDLNDYRRKMSIREKYNEAISSVELSGLTQITLLKIAQSKVSDNLRSTADSIAYIKNTIKYFNLTRQDDINFLDVDQFKYCLNTFKVVLSDIQSIALFAFFDNDFKG